MKYNIYITIIIITFALSSCIETENESSSNKSFHFQTQPINLDTTKLNWVKSKYLESSEIILQKEGFVVSFNKKTNQPNWVSWEIKKPLLLSNIRQGEYQADNQLPYPNQVSPKDYPNIGYSMAHMCPISNMSWNRKAKQDCMLMSNICPQKESVNNGIWKGLENLCNNWAYQEDDIFIVAGPIFFDKPTIKISEDTNIYIPDAFFKVVLSLHDSSPKTIGFKIYNNGEKKNINEIATNVDQIEEITGLDFFSTLPDSTENKIESTYSLAEWPQSINNIFNINECEYVYSCDYIIDNYFHYDSNCNLKKDNGNYSLLLYDNAIQNKLKECIKCKEGLKMAEKPIEIQDNDNSNHFVYINNKPLAKRYHMIKNCRGLKSANGNEIKRITRKEAKKMGRTPCLVCYTFDDINNSKMNNLSWNDSFIQEKNLNKTKHSNSRIPLWMTLLFITFFSCFLILLLLYFFDKKKQNSKDYSKLTSLKPENADTKIISTFLQQFAKKDALKFTTHFWDKTTDLSQSQYESFDDFKKQYCEVLLQWKDNVSNKCPSLWDLISNFFALEEDDGNEWSEHGIRIGYNKYVRKWMEEHPGEEPLNMPLSAFPVEMRPGLIDKRSVSSFQEIVDVFKRCIEFRDDDLYYMVWGIFKNCNLVFDKSNLKCLQGRNFYTDTELVEKAIKIIAGNISQHGNSSNVRVNYQFIQEKDNNKIIIEFLHIDSYSNKDINDPRITAEDKNGAMATIKNILRNLCDFSVESTFRVKNKQKPLRINYLVSNPSEKGIYEILEEDCSGFKYILTFYTDFK